MMVPDTILKTIKSPAEIIQFAKDGKYEEAWIISLGDEISDKQIKEYVSDPNYKKLIVEYIWNPNIDEKRYVLTVVQDEKCKEKDKYEFVNKCLKFFEDKSPFESLIKRIDEEIVGHEFLLQQPVQKVRLGVFNHWFSVGPIEIWDDGDELNEEIIGQKIKARPEVLRSKLNYQGLAFIYNFDGSLPGPYHVFKTPTCHKRGDEWVVDIPLVDKNMKIMGLGMLK